MCRNLPCRPRWGETGAPSRRAPLCRSFSPRNTWLLPSAHAEANRLKVSSAAESPGRRRLVILMEARRQASRAMRGRCRNGDHRRVELSGGAR